MWEDKTCIPISIMETNHHLPYKCHCEWFVCFVFSHMFCHQKILLPLVFRRNFIKSVLMKLSYLMIVCVEEKTCIPFSIMETNYHLHYKCHWGSFVCFVFLQMFCRQKPFCLSFLGKPLIACGKRKHAYLFPLWRPITTCIGVIGDHLCV